MADRVRVGGSGYTYFRYAGNILAFAEEVRVAGPAPVADYVRVQPLNAQRPVEIITPGAHTGGTLTMVLTELYNKAVWQRLSAALNNSQDIIDIMRHQAESDPEAIVFEKIINPPQPGLPNRVETFFGCRIVRVQEDETINIRAMRIDKEIDVAYLYSVKHYINGGNRLFELNPATGTSQG
jgi:hypothetical protein